MNYKDMSLKEIADYINKELGLGRNFTEIAQNDFKNWVGEIPYSL